MTVQNRASLILRWKSALAAGDDDDVLGARVGSALHVAFRRCRRRLLAPAEFPTFLFSVEWYWQSLQFHQSYFTVAVPALGLQIVTAGAQRGIPFDVPHRALGYVERAGEMSRESVGHLIRNYWRQCPYQRDILPWSVVVDEGVVREAQAVAWRHEVWTPDFVEELIPAVAGGGLHDAS